MVPIDTELVSTLLKYCEHILLGLNYLTEKGFIHRYLMAKHILVTDENVCKVSHSTARFSKLAVFEVTKQSVHAFSTQIHAVRLSSLELAHTSLDYMPSNHS